MAKLYTVLQFQTNPKCGNSFHTLFNYILRENLMTQDRIIYLNKEFVDKDQATVHVSSHGFSRGSAIFEVLSYYLIENNSFVFRLDRHIKRLFKSASSLNMELPVTSEELMEAVLETVRRNNCKQG